MEISYHIFPADIRRNFRHSVSRAPGSAMFLLMLLSIVPMSMLAVLLWDGWSRHTPIIWTLLTFFAILAPFVLIAAIFPMHASEQLYPKGVTAPLSTTEIAADYLRFDRRVMDDDELKLKPVEAAWSEVSSIYWHGGDIVFVCSGKISNNFIPRSAFANPQQAELFYDTARRFWEATKYRTQIGVDEDTVWPPAPSVGNSVEPGDSRKC